MRTDLIITSRIHEEIAAWVQAGRDLDEIEAALIDPAPMGEENRAALWLYAWGLREGGAGASRARAGRARFSGPRAQPHPQPRPVVTAARPSRPRTAARAPELIAIH